MRGRRVGQDRRDIGAADGEVERPGRRVVRERPSVLPTSPSAVRLDQRQREVDAHPPRHQVQEANPLCDCAGVADCTPSPMLSPRPTNGTVVCARGPPVSYARHRTVAIVRIARIYERGS